MGEQQQFHMQHQQQWQQMQQQMRSSSNIGYNSSNRKNDSDKLIEVPLQIERKGISGTEGRSGEAPVGRPGGAQVAKVKVGPPPKYEGDGKDELFPRRRKSSLVMV